jgi:hypothetical protein
VWSETAAGLCILSGVRIVGLLLILVATVGQAADRAACTTADPSCLEQVPLGPGGRFSLVYRSFPLTVRNPHIQRALIIVHGAGRDADSYFLSGVAGALIAGALENSLVIAPRLASNSGGCKDPLKPGEISWGCGGEQDWRGGGTADGLKVATFDFIDELLRMLARRKVFPNLRVIVVTGHSAGGQFTNRYVAATHVVNGLGVPVKYVVSNPSSYLYLDATRLPAGATCANDGTCTGDFKEYAESQKCANYNRWRNGLEQRAGYATTVSDDDLRRQMASRDVTYLLGALDTLPLFGFDSSCAAMAQGPSRLARGLTYWNYMKSKYGAQHKLVVVPACGHNGRCMYTDRAALPVLFP